MAAGTFYAADVNAATCESLASLALPDAKVTMAQPVAAGAFESLAPGAAAETRWRICRRSAAWRRR